MFSKCWILGNVNPHRCTSNDWLPPSFPFSLKVPEPHVVAYLAVWLREALEAGGCGLTVLEPFKDVAVLGHS